ncbi:hypothetical protein NHQ30_001141 [Ciborinia camelliae]|nr:hypothetical protein NHQ30_001141 [Ciborinia camelliae]
MTKSSDSDNINKVVPRDNPSDSDNPFIRFRHFADEQMSSILQGFIGLPSAFAKPQNGSQWSVFDEELKRRDELHARRRGLKEAEKTASSNRTISDDDEVQIPVKKSQNSHGQVGSDCSLPDRRMAVFASNDIPLYSPLHSPMTTPLSGDLKHIFGSFAAIMVYQADPSDISLVPYLFGSPYSPISLSLGESNTRDLGVTRKFRESGTARRDDFPYCEAFEDLLFTSQGRDTEARTSRLKSTATEESESSRLENGFAWIERLRRLGILHLPNSNLSRNSNESHPSKQEGAVSSQGATSSVSRLTGLGKDAETEEQMYESFLTNASTTPHQFFTTLESTLTAVEKLMKSKNMTFEETRQSISAGVKETDMSGKSISEPSESKREVSSSSIVEHFTDEDGSVETTILVWKRFADGSETETSSSHKVDKATRQRDIAKADYDCEEFMSSQHRNGSRDQENESKTKKNTKSGWFWN